MRKHNERQGRVNREVRMGKTERGRGDNQNRGKNVRRQRQQDRRKEIKKREWKAQKKCTNRLEKSKGNEEKQIK